MRHDHILAFKSHFTLSPLLYLNKYTEVQGCTLEGVICNGSLGRKGIEPNTPKNPVLEDVLFY